MPTNCSPPAGRVKALEWSRGRLRLLDQRRLPHQVQWLEPQDAPATARAIRDMVVRGAPAIGITAAYGAVLAARTAHQKAGADWRQAMQEDLRTLREARPTAVNLGQALNRMERRCREPCDDDPEPALLQEARAIHQEDADACRRMAELGTACLAADPPTAVYTHCNTGSLATGGCGTALGVIRRAHAAGHIRLVYAGETRPWLQGARLTAWELLQDRIPSRLVVDSAAAALMHRGEITWVITGADRIAANGDLCNKIGTYALALAARHHEIRFMAVAPTSTIDPQLPTGAEIPLEERPQEEITHLADTPIAPPGAQAGNPVFDITPAALIDILITERGTVHHPDRERIAALLTRPRHKSPPYTPSSAER